MRERISFEALVRTYCALASAELSNRVRPVRSPCPAATPSPLGQEQRFRSRLCFRRGLHFASLGLPRGDAWAHLSTRSYCALLISSHFQWRLELFSRPSAVHEPVIRLSRHLVVWGPLRYPWAKLARLVRLLLLLLSGGRFGTLSPN